MKLSNEYKSIEITIDSYEFPYHETNEFHDNNWLNVKAICEDEVLVEDGVDACLLTSELQDVLKGLNKALIGETYRSSFLEPTFFMEVKPTQNDIQVMISFHLPNRHLFDVKTVISKEALNEMIEEVKHMVSQFPIRQKQLFN